MRTDIRSIIRACFIFGFLISGTYFIFKAIFNPSITGAMTGSTGSTSYYMLLGVAFLIITLVLTYHHDKK